MDPAAALAARIAARDAGIGAFLPEPGRAERLSAAPPADGVLAGMPVAVKDVINVDGLPTRAGSALPPEEFAGPEAGAVTRLRAAGALLAGKTVTCEFAMTAPSATRNPRNPDHTPGGSSSGSAAAVAAGTVPAALGTQTVGSVIRPAAYCGIAGFRPTHGRVPIDGVFPNAPTLDVVGVLADRIDTAARVAAVLVDGWRADAGGAPDPVLAVPDGPLLDAAEPAARTAFEEAVAALRGAGLTVRRIPMLADLDRIRAVQHTVNRYEAARVHARLYDVYGDRYRPESARTVLAGRAIAAASHRRALDAREEIRAALAARAAAEGVGAWLTPAATGPAPRRELGTTGSAAMCVPWSLAGLPAAAVAGGGAVDGLPVGVQVVGGDGRDEELLRIAGAVEEALRLSR